LLTIVAFLIEEINLLRNMIVYTINFINSLTISQMLQLILSLTNNLRQKISEIRNQKTDKKQKVKLEKKLKQPETFSTGYKEYKAFKKSFKAYTEQENLDDLDKFKVLMSYLRDEAYNYAVSIAEKFDGNEGKTKFYMLGPRS
jgi:hypothetical protein